MKLLRWCCCVSLVLLVSCGKPGPAEADIRENNRGVGLMGYFQYQQAADLFQALVTRYPTWQPVKVNLGIATLNLQTPGSEDRATALFQEVLAADPLDVRALYCAGLLHVYKGEDDQALNYFEKALGLAPEDPHIHYYLGQCQARLGNYEAALARYEATAALDPYLRSAYYGSFQAYQRLGKRAEAREEIALFQKLKNNPQARQVEFKYTRMGALAEVKTVDRPGRKAVPPKGPLLAEGRALALPEGLGWGKGRALSCADLNGDGQVDLLVAGGWLRGETALNAVYLGDGDSLTAAPEHPLVQVDGVNAAAFGDVNNDGFSDAFLCRNGLNQLWLGGADGAWAPAPQQPDEDRADSVDVALIDADHDGDLDLFVVNDGAPNHLLNNNLDGSWRVLGGDAGFAATARSKRVVCADLDNDRDLDLIVVNASPPHEVYLNNLLWDYTAGEGFEALIQAPIAGLISGDRDADGMPELYSCDPNGVVARWSRGEDGVWFSQELIRGATSPDLAWLDLNGTGRFLPVVHTADGFVGLDEDGAVFKQAATGVAGAWLPMVLAPEAGPAIVGMDTTGALSLMAPGLGRFPFASLSFSGAISGDDATRSNLSGIGARYAVRNGSQWTAAATWRQSSGPGQSLAPTAIGLGGAEALDFLAITWSDGVFQTELQVAAGKHHLITETQRQLASCPVLFVWDGTEYRFVSDVLGVAGIGFNVGKGEYGEPRPWEYFELPEGLAQPSDGALKLKIAEPMEESAYLDFAQVVAYDLPEGWRMVLDERMGLAEPLPTGAPVFYRNERLPLAVTDADGNDVLAAVTAADQRAAPVPEIDTRFLGLLQREHVVTLDFGERLDATPGRAYLVIDGWVEYPYSQTCFAAWQAGKAYEALSLDVPAGNGWRTVLAQFGYPAGMPRRMALPLPQAATATGKLRLRTNQEIYLDRVAVVYGESLAPDSHVLTLQQADLVAEGFAKRTTGPQRLPQYDDARRQPLWDTRHQAGFYTRLGPVVPLLREHDDALAVIGPGEAVTLAFGPLPPQAAGTTRRLVLEIRGWCKDMDLYTRDGETLAPLPASGKDPAARERLHGLFNTRYQAGH